MADAKKMKRTIMFRVRLTADEKDQLEDGMLSHDMSMSGLVRHALRAIGVLGAGRGDALKLRMAVLGQELDWIKRQMAEQANN